jgi:outer membrane protein assembly factor BamB
MKSLVSWSAVPLSLAVCMLGAVLAEDWPGFRGNHGGVAVSQDLPTKVTKDNLLWKLKMPGVGTSSPITYGDKIFVTAYKGYGTALTKQSPGAGKKGGGGGGGFGKGGPPDADQKNLRLLVLCVDARDGKIVWQKEVTPKFPEINFSGMFREHGYASSTPATDGERVIAFFGKSGVHAFDMEGKALWSADVGDGTHMWGSASSPVLYGDLVIVNAGIESKKLVALDKRTGKEVWTAKALGTSWGSPALVETKDGKTEVVVSWPGKIVAYDPLTGSQKWTCDGIGAGGGGGGGGGGGFGGGKGMGGGYTSSTPVSKDGIVYAIGGGGPTPTTALAVTAGGSGDVTKTNVLWRSKSGSNAPSPVIVGNELCWVDGSLTALDLASGKSVAKDRLYDARGEYVSAVASGSKIYALTRSDGLFVLDAADKFTQLDHHEFDGDTSIFNASPAISNGKLILRSNAYLYCIGKKS